MRSILKKGILPVLICLSTQVNGQVLISLLFGEALNTPKIEFGLTGGFNRSWIFDIENSKGLHHFNLGFYFHINMKNQSYLSTGVLVKSNVGASGMPTYPIGDPDFDEVFEAGELIKQINYFYVPILFHQRFNNNRWYAEGGFQLGLRGKAYDIFEVEDFEDGDISYKKDARDQYKHLDAGVTAGVGYKWKKEIKSISTGVNFYYGLMNVSKVDDVKVKNSSLYVYVKIPIGAGGKDKKKNGKKQEGGQQ